MSDVRRAKRYCVLYVTPNDFERLENSVAKLLVFVFACFGWLVFDGFWVLMEINRNLRKANNSLNEYIRLKQVFI